jgi:hypothetical protein
MGKRGPGRKRNLKKVSGRLGGLRSRDFERDVDRIVAETGLSRGLVYQFIARGTLGGGGCPVRVKGAPEFVVYRDDGGEDG